MEIVDFLHVEILILVLPTTHALGSQKWRFLLGGKKSPFVIIRPIILSSYIYQKEHISQYKDSTADKRRTYGELLAKDKKGVAELSSNNHKLARLQEEITDFKKKVSIPKNFLYSNLKCLKQNMIWIQIV